MLLAIRIKSTEYAEQLFEDCRSPAAADAPRNVLCSSPTMAHSSPFGPVSIQPIHYNRMRP